MKKKMFKVSILLPTLLIVGLFAWGRLYETIDVQHPSIEKIIQNQKVTEKDFKITIAAQQVEPQLKISVTYIGDKDKINIFHGGSIFYVNVYQKDGPYKNYGEMPLPLLSTTLFKNQPHVIEYKHMKFEDLKPGTYEIEALADFFTKTGNGIEKKFRIPTSTILIFQQQSGNLDNEGIPQSEQTL